MPVRERMTQVTPIIFHIDVNSAYLSWTAVEQLKNGAKVDIREIPAIIGGDQKSRHGVVLAKSTSAKKYCECLSQVSESCDVSAGSSNVSGEKQTDDGIFKDIYEGDRAGQRR